LINEKRLPLKKISKIIKTNSQQAIDQVLCKSHFKAQEIRSRHIVKIDARTLSGFFLPVIVAKAKLLKKNSVLLVVQSFEPVPLYSVLAKLGFLYCTEKINNQEYHVYFVRKKEL